MSKNNKQAAPAVIPAIEAAQAAENAGLAMPPAPLTPEQAKALKEKEREAKREALQNAVQAVPHDVREAIRRTATVNFDDAECFSVSLINTFINKHKGEMTPIYEAAIAADIVKKVKNNKGGYSFENTPEQLAEMVSKGICTKRQADMIKSYWKAVEAIQKLCAYDDDKAAEAAKALKAEQRLQKLRK